MRLRRTAIITLVFTLTLLGPTPATAQSDVDHVDYKHSFVQIGSITLRPQAKRVPKENALAWLNYTPYVARVVFDSEVGTKLHCKSPSSFTLDGERLVSPKIQGRQFVSLCKLEPGTYAYRVELVASGVSSDRVLEGTITVE